MNKSKLFLLNQILSQATAPFREDNVINFVTSLFDEKRVPYFLDPIGNVIVGVKSKQAYLNLIQKEQKEPVRVFIAHMDHPGFHGSKWLSKNQLKIKWHGGSPIKHLNGANVWLAVTKSENGDGCTYNGKLSNIKIHKHGHSLDTATVNINTRFMADFDGSLPPAKQVYGAFDFKKPVWNTGKRIYTRVADDLVGVFCIVSLALDHYSKMDRSKINKSGKSNSQEFPFIGLLTRAEEVGFVGAIGHFQLAWLEKARRSTVCISLEASRTLPGAEIGKGPIVRLGDRRTVFDSDGSQLLSMLAQQVLPGKHQRRIMDGGSCEGTATTAFGFPVIALSVPLGNYHNQGYEGGQECKKPNGPAPEFVHLDDIKGQLKLCHALMRDNLAWRTPWNTVKIKLTKNYDKYQRYL